ncbi:MAG TPA: cytochrome c [Phenylobacterium sp.]|nr:cytochrome c [Phenylobacterium sp.]
MRLITSLAAIAAVVLAASPSLAADGEHIFLENCAACHRPNGVGVPGAFPALKGSKIANGDPAGPIGRVLNGKGGMPSFQNELSDADIVAVLNYVRASWGNKARPIAPTQVAALRGGGRRENAKAALQAH